MAQGTLTLFEEFADGINADGLDLDTDVLKLGLINNTPPSVSQGQPTWGDYSANEVGVGGGYPVGGITLAGTAFTEVNGIATLVANDIALAQNGAGFTDAFWAILYDFTSATDIAIGFIELDGPISEQAGPMNINWNASGIFTVTINPPA